MSDIISVRCHQPVFFSFCPASDSSQALRTSSTDLILPKLLRLVAPSHSAFAGRGLINPLGANLCSAFIIACSWTDHPVLLPDLLLPFLTPPAVALRVMLRMLLRNECQNGSIRHYDVVHYHPSY